MTLHERLKAEEDNVLDRRRISEESERKLNITVTNSRTSNLTGRSRA